MGDPKKSLDKAINNANKVAMSLSDLFCVDRHKSHFLNLVKNNLDITFANEQEITSLIEAKTFEEVINFSRQLNKLVIITRGEKGAVAINGDEVVESDIQKNLKIVDLTGAGDLFAAGFLHGYINKLSTKECLEKGTEMSSKVIQQIKQDFKFKFSFFKTPLPFLGLTIFGLYFLVNKSLAMGFFLFDLIAIFFTGYEIIIIKCV